MVEVGKGFFDMLRGGNEEILAEGLNGPRTWSGGSIAMGEPRRTVVFSVSSVCMRQK